MVRYQFPNNTPEFEAKLAQKRAVRMAQIDGLPRPTREIVHEYGWTLVKAFLDCGVTSPKQIRHLVEVVLSERGTFYAPFSSQGTRAQTMERNILNEGHKK